MSACSFAAASWNIDLWIFPLCRCKPFWCSWSVQSLSVCMHECMCALLNVHMSEKERLCLCVFVLTRLQTCIGVLWVFMLIFVCVCVCTLSVYAFLHVCVCVCVRRRMCVCVGCALSVYAYLHVCVCVCVRAPDTVSVSAGTAPSFPSVIRSCKVKSYKSAVKCTRPASHCDAHAVLCTRRMYPLTKIHAPSTPLHPLHPFFLLPILLRLILFSCSSSASTSSSSFLFLFPSSSSSSAGLFAWMKNKCDLSSLKPNSRAVPSYHVAHMLHVIGAQCDLLTIAPGLLEHMCRRQFAEQWGDCKNLKLHLSMQLLLYYHNCCFQTTSNFRNHYH